MDGPPALTLGLEAVRDNLMKNSPVDRKTSIITKGLWFKIISMGLIASGLFFTQMFFNVLNGTPEQERTILFNLFVILQLFNAFNCREIDSQSIFKNILSNKSMIVVFGITIAIQIIMVEFFESVFRTVALPFFMWIKIFSYSFLIIIISEIGKGLFRLFRNK